MEQNGVFSRREVRLLREVVSDTMRDSGVEPDNEQAREQARRMARHVLQAYAHGVHDRRTLREIAIQSISRSSEQPFAGP